jgi:hypothetical protein
MRKAAQDDLGLAVRMKQVLKQDPRLGFQSEIYGYSFSRELLDRKTRQVRAMLEQLISFRGCCPNPKSEIRNPKQA